MRILIVSKSIDSFKKLKKGVWDTVQVTVTWGYVEQCPFRVLRIPECNLIFDLEGNRSRIYL
jgi:hypothetical protein